MKERNIAGVKGIQCWGAHAGIKSKRRDLALIYSEVPASAAAVFTQNVVIAEPLKINKEHIKGGQIQAIAINSGNANACTGEQGRRGAEAMVNAVAKSLKIPREYVLIASTGVIGERFPTQKVTRGIKASVPKLSSRKVAGSLTASAILTTDTFPKEGYLSFELDKKPIQLAGIAKGSGMIHPNMATMMAFLVSDVAIEPALLDKALRDSVDRSFNMITVDGDTSTNDMVAILCNGQAGNKPITRQGKDYRHFQKQLDEICTHLAKLIVSDGEGATKFIEYQVIHAPSEEEARKIVRTISNSNLVKTAIFGQDPNWGRIMAAAGRAGVTFDPEKTHLYMGSEKNVQIVKNGHPCRVTRATLQKIMQGSLIRIVLDLNQGKAEAVGWGADFSYEYVRINAEYTT